MLRKITPTLKLNDAGEKVANLQDALRFLVDKERLKIDDPSIREKLLRGLASDRDRQVFGEKGTFPLVRIFQTLQGLSETGVVDEPTAQVLYKLLDGLG